MDVVATDAAGAVAWCRDVAGQRECRPLQGASPMSVFVSVEADALIALPGRDFVLADWSRATVGPDPCQDRTDVVLGAVAAYRPHG
jgi:hypothetical protein